MLLILCSHFNAGKTIAKVQKIVGEFRVVTPETVDSVRGLHAHTLIISKPVELSAEQAFTLVGCFSMMWPGERDNVSTAIYTITKGGAPAVGRHTGKLIRRIKSG